MPAVSIPGLRTASGHPLRISATTVSNEPDLVLEPHSVIPESRSPFRTGAGYRAAGGLRLFADRVAVTVLQVAGPCIQIARGMGERFVNAYPTTRRPIFSLPGIIILILLVFAPLLYTFVLSSAHNPKDMPHHRDESGPGSSWGCPTSAPCWECLTSAIPTFLLDPEDPILFTVFTVIIQTVIGIGMSLILNRQELKFRTTFRTALILPRAIPTYVSALIFNYLFSSGTTGFMNQCSVSSGNSRSIGCTMSTWGSW
jgi:hypothetical protein